MGELFSASLLLLLFRNERYTANRSSEAMQQPDIIIFNLNLLHFSGWEPCSFMINSHVTVYS